MPTLAKTFIAVFVAVFTALSVPLGWAAPLPLEGTLSTNVELDFVPRYDLRTSEFTVSGGGTSQDLGRLLFTTPGGPHVSAGNPIGSLIDLDTSWLLQTRGPNIFPPSVHGTLHFDTPEFAVPNCTAPGCQLTNIPLPRVGSSLAGMSLGQERPRWRFSQAKGLCSLSATPSRQQPLGQVSCRNPRLGCC